MILRDPRLGGTYQLVLTREEHMDNLEVRCELQRQHTGMSDSNRAAVASELALRIKSNIGISTRITVLDTDTIPRTLVGKAKRVLDERPKLQ
jgi:phenylacetate-CoA ligase